jgi:hypothetical protein
VPLKSPFSTIGITVEYAQWLSGRSENVTAFSADTTEERRRVSVKITKDFIEIFISFSLIFS